MAMTTAESMHPTVAGQQGQGAAGIQRLMMAPMSQAGLGLPGKGLGAISGVQWLTAA